jgi:hypothetical protein
MKKLSLFYLLVLGLTQISCSEIGSEIEKEANHITIDNKKYELSEFISPNEEFMGIHGYEIESWVYSKSIIFDEKKCDFLGEGYGASLFFNSSAPNSIDPGIYKIVNSSINNPKKNEAGGELDFLSKSINNEETLISGSIEVTKNSSEYTIKLDATTEKSKKVKLYFKGSLKLLNC